MIEFLRAYLLDSYAMATLLLAIVAALAIWQTHPAARVFVFRSACCGLLFLLLINLVPHWPRWHFAGGSPSRSPHDNPAGALAPGALAPGTLAPSHGPANSALSPARHNVAPHRVSSKPLVASKQELKGGNGGDSQDPSLTAASALELGSRSSFFSSAAGWLAPLAWWGFLVTALMIVARLLLGGLLVQRMLRDTRAASPRLEAQLMRLVPMASARPRLRLCGRLRQPVAVGWWRRYILLPQRFEAANDMEVMTALAHEWAHLRRHDQRFRIFSRWLLIPFCWHPLYWWLLREMDQAQEELADAEAAGDAALDYVATLLTWARGARFLPAGSMTASVGRSGPLKRRITALLRRSEESPRPPASGRFCLLALFVALAVVLVSLASLRAAPPLITRQLAAPATPSILPTKSKSPASAQPSYESIEALLLANGGQIELVGIRERSCFGDQWWLPDGSPLCELAEHGGTDGITVRELVLTLPDQRTSLIWQVADGREGGFIDQAESDRQSGQVTLRLPLKEQSINLRLGIPSDDWKPWASSSAQGTTKTPSEKQHFDYWMCRDDPSAAVLTVALASGLRKVRVVAVDSKGHRHLGQRTTTTSHEITASFPALRGETIEQILVEQQSVEWFELRNLSLQPGHRTNVQVVTTPTVARQG